MTRAQIAWLLLGILSLASFAVAQGTAWEKYMDAAKAAFDRGQYDEAEKQLLPAAARGGIPGVGRQRQANLRLDTKEGAFADRGGYQVIVPGDGGKGSKATVL